MQWSIQYGSGPAAGHLIRDVVTLHGLEVENQTMALADTGLNTLLYVSLSFHKAIATTLTSSNIRTSDFDGILGLAFSSIAETQEPTVVENLLSEGVISNHLFGVYMARSSDDVKGDSEDDYYSAVSEYINENGYGGLGKRQETVSASGAPTDTELGGLGDDPFGDGDEPLPSATGDSGGGSSGGFRQPTTQVDGGVIHLGYANEDFYQGDINYQDLSFAGYWQIEIDGFTDGGDSISGTDQYTILDTGQSCRVLCAAECADFAFDRHHSDLHAH